MTRAQQDEHARNRQAAARQYRKLGYEVIECPSDDQLPPFLRGFTPNLIATRDDDRVVLEVKRRDELKGSKQFVALATAVAQQIGWRLELIHLASRKPAMADPDSRRVRHTGAG